MNKNMPLYLIVIAAALHGCTFAPRYERPAPPVSADWPKGAAYQEPGSTVETPARASDLPWRDFFRDKRLQDIIETALKNNRDLRLAALNVEKARAYYGIQRAELLPSFQAVGAENRERVPADLSSTREAVTSERYEVNFGVSSWEIDFFGRIRSLKDRALEEYLATDQALRNTRILMISAVANGYFALAADREALKLAASTLEAQEASYRLIRKRFDAGLASKLDLRQAQTQVDAARGDLARYTQLAAQDENVLNLLVGYSLPPASLPDDLGAVAPLQEVSAGLSSDVLLKRPDVLAAEHRLKGANANIGAARAAFFPRITLTTALGTASADLSGLFEDGSGLWRFAPRIAIPIFDARTWSAYDVAKVERKVALAQYEKAIQTAFREVADALAIRGTVDRQIASQESLLDAVSDAYRLSNLRYTTGIDSYLSVLDAQRSLYGAQRGIIALRLARLSNIVRLYTALGGGGGDCKDAVQPADAQKKDTQG